MDKKAQQQFIRPLIYIFIFLIFLLALFFEGKGINLVTELFTRILISLFYSIIAGSFVGLIPLNWISVFNVNIFGFRFNILATILTFIIKMWLF